MKSTHIRFGVGVTLGVALLLGSTSPALAAQSRVLPDDQGLYTLSCGGPANQLYSLDVASGLASTVGTGESVGEDETECSIGAAYDPATDGYFYLQFADLRQHLRSLDPVSGTSIRGPQLTTDEGDFSADALAIGSDGSAYVLSSRLSNEFGPGSPRTGLFSLDVESGRADFIATIGGRNDFFTAFSFDRTTGAFYVVETRGAVSTLDVATGTLTSVGTVTLTDGETTSSSSIQALAIDDNGTFWLSNLERVENPERLRVALWSVDRANLSSGSQLSGALRTGDTSDEELAAQTLLIGPAPAAPAPLPVQPAAEPVKPVLAETGVNDAASTAVAGSAALALLLGGAALTVARARRKAQA